MTCIVMRGLWKVSCQFLLGAWYKREAARFDCETMIAHWTAYWANAEEGVN